MKALLDENLDKKLKALLLESGIDCQTVTGAGYRGKKNGELLALAESAYDVFITMDKAFANNRTSSEDELLC